MTNFHGKFVWYELMTTDSKAAETFYRSVIGWGAKDPGIPGMSYTLYTIGDVPVAGMMTMPPEAPAGTPPGWIGYIAVDDVDTRAKEIAESGGAICHGPSDIPGIGRFAVVSDPQNVVFALFKPGEGPQGDPLPPRTPGKAGWHELHAMDGASAFAYYSKLFGWTKGEALDMGPMGIYQLFNHDDVMVGGIFTKPAAEPMPYWLFYFNVEEINAAIERVKAGGGQILNGPMEVPGGSMIVQCLDPQGAIFALVEPRGGPEAH
jgi:predicted enzyme related to lactoylglutathione lyase